MTALPLPIRQAMLSALPETGQSRPTPRLPLSCSRALAPVWLIEYRVRGGAGLWPPMSRSLVFATSGTGIAAALV